MIHKSVDNPLVRNRVTPPRVPTSGRFDEEEDDDLENHRELREHRLYGQEDEPEEVEEAGEGKKNHSTKARIDLSCLQRDAGSEELAPLPMTACSTRRGRYGAAQTIFFGLCILRVRPANIVVLNFLFFEASKLDNVSRCSKMFHLQVRVPSFHESQIQLWVFLCHCLFRKFNRLFLPFRCVLASAQSELRCQCSQNFIVH